jgi:hypothetical protein
VSPETRKWNEENLSWFENRVLLNDNVFVSTLVVVSLASAAALLVAWTG